MHKVSLIKRLMLILPMLFVCSALVAPLLSARFVSAAPTLVGVKEHYLALGDSLAFGFQIDLDFKHGYANEFASYLRPFGSKKYVNFACPGESSVTMLKGKCPYAFLRKFPYVGPQLDAALLYIKLHRGKVSPITLDIGANDVLPNVDLKTCIIDQQQFATNLATLDYNLTKIILPKLRTALTVDGKLTGDIFVLNYYNPYQNVCPGTASYVAELNQHLAEAVKGVAILADAYTAFGGINTPNPNLCTYTWICYSRLPDIHATDKGYRVMASSLKHVATYQQPTS